MKKTILSLLILLIVSNITFAQSIDDLDKKYGYKDIKLDESYDKWKSNLIENSIQIDKYGNTVGCLINSKFYEVFGYKVDKIFLTFQDAKLVKIQINLEYFQIADLKNEKYSIYRLDDFNKLVAGFEFLFGKGTKMNGSDDSIISIWLGKLVILDLRYFNYGVAVGDQGIIYLTKKSFADSQIKSGF